MKRKKEKSIAAGDAVIVRRQCVTAMGVLLVMGLLAKMMELTAIAIQRAAIDLTNTARDWLRWAVEE